MPDRIEEIESQIEALNAELKKRKEYNDLVKQVENPDFKEFLEIANKFISQFEREIPLKYGTVDAIKMSYWCGKWTVRYNLKPALIRDTIYDVSPLDDINLRIDKHIKSKREKMLSDRASRLYEKGELEEKIRAIDEDLKEFDENVEKLRTVE